MRPRRFYRKSSLRRFLAARISRRGLTRKRRVPEALPERETWRREKSERQSYACAASRLSFAMEEVGSPRVSALSAYRAAAQLRGKKPQLARGRAGQFASPRSKGLKKRPDNKWPMHENCSVPTGAAHGARPEDSPPGKKADAAAKLATMKRRSLKRRSRGVALPWRVHKRTVGAASAPGGEGNQPSAPARHPRVSGSSLRGLLHELAEIQHSRQRAALLFEWLIAPVSAQHFFEQYWEKKPLLVQRRNPDYYQGLFSTAELDAALRDHEVHFGVHLDVTSYVDGKRETHNPVGRAMPAVVWDYYRHGCSLRMLNPQAFSATVWHFLSLLQEQFGSMVGANTYLTPAATQGFAPHYDDIEAFVVQLEGKKHWRVYSPRKEAEVLPQFSSNNLDPREIGEPMLEIVLEAGDLLYFPRGFIHQGDCLPDAHSLHITVSTYQRNSWGDLLQKLLPAALQMAIEDDVEYRQGLPRDYLEYMGVLNSDRTDRRRTAFRKKVQTLITKLINYAPFDAAVDQKAKDFLHDCLPPVLTDSEKALSVHGLPARWENGDVQGLDVSIKKNTRVRLLRYGAVRLCNEGGDILLYYTTENSRVYHKEDPKYCEIEPEYMDGIEFLIFSYPKYVSVDVLPCATLDDKIALATVLFEKGLLITKSPLLSV